MAMFWMRCTCVCVYCTIIALGRRHALGGRSLRLKPQETHFDFLFFFIAVVLSSPFSLGGRVMMVCSSESNSDDNGGTKPATSCVAKRGMASLRATLSLVGVCLLCGASSFADAFAAPSGVAFSGAIDGRCSLDTAHHTPAALRSPSALSLFGKDGDDNDGDDDTATDSKFGMAQRIESLKSVVLGALAGGVAVTPVAYLHYVYASAAPSIAQWEFVTDMSALQAALFAIVYRYAVRAGDDNPMLNQGVVGAFVVVRTLANIQVTDTCLSVPLRCECRASLCVRGDVRRVTDGRTCTVRVARFAFPHRTRF